MGFEDIFKSASNVAVSLFAEEQGESTYKKRLPTSLYDPVSGVSTPEYTDYEVLIAFVGLSDADLGKSSSRAMLKKGLISGDHLPIIPEKKDRVIDTFGGEFIIVEVETDMYSALHTVFLKEVNKD